VTPDARLSSKLDRGEAAALTLAVASQSRLILVDERRARGVAKQLGLNVTGSLGVLLIAKSQGLIPAVSPLVDQMIAQGRHISPRVRAEILKAAGEPAT
jgi:predicted nucleic acid-binding protein